MRDAGDALDLDVQNELGKRRLTLTRLLIWAEQEAVELGRNESAALISKAIGELFEAPEG